MVGPPGTGKTLLARAVAGEADVPFFALTGSSFVEMFVGVGAARVRDLFAAARKAAPAIIFIDEVDAIGQRRGGALVSNDEREQTLNQLLAEMDGFDPSAGVVVLAATNRPETLDPALLRPGRFDRQVEIPLPNAGARRDPRRARARQAPRRRRRSRRGRRVRRPASRAPTSRISSTRRRSWRCAPNATRSRAPTSPTHAIASCSAGARRPTRSMPEEKHAVAVHESGHALVAALLAQRRPGREGHDPARGPGARRDRADSRPTNVTSIRESYLKDSLAVRLGGRAAELLVLGEASSGAASDLAGATELATRMVREYGMSDRARPVGFASGSPMYLGTEAGAQPRATRRRRSGSSTKKVGEAPARGRSSARSQSSASTATRSTGWSRTSSRTRPSTARRCRQSSHRCPRRLRPSAHPRPEEQSLYAVRARRAQDRSGAARVALRRS